MFSDRVPRDRAPNRLTAAVEAMRRQGRAFADLTETNPTRAAFYYPEGLLAAFTDARALRYNPAPFGAAEARRAVSREYERQGLDVSADRIVLTASTSEAYSLLFKLLADAGDEVLVPRPSYPLFDHLARLDLVQVRPYDLEYHGRWETDAVALARAITPRTRAVLVVSPNNPTGSAVTADEIDRVAAACGERGVALIVDEVFADYELEPGAMARAGRAARVRDALTFGLGGLSKSVGLPQVKLGWIAVSGPDAMVHEALDRLELVCDTYLSVSTQVQVAADELLERGAAVRRQIALRIRANYERLAALVDAVPSCRLLDADGGWSAVLNVPTYESEEDLVVRLLTEHEVLTHPGFFFDFPRESFLVVSLLTPEATFAQGAARILRHFDCNADPGHV